MTQDEVKAKYCEVREANSAWLRSELHAEAAEKPSKAKMTKLELSLGALMILADPEFQTPANEWFLLEMEIVRREALESRDVEKYREETNLAFLVAFDTTA